MYYCIFHVSPNFSLGLRIFTVRCPNIRSYQFSVELIYFENPLWLIYFSLYVQKNRIFKVQAFQRDDSEFT
jgi:hypothetical protein